MERRKANQPPWSETEFRRRLKLGDVAFPPACLRLLEMEPQTECGPKPDGMLEVGWQGSTQRFVFEYKASSKPKEVEAAMLQAQRYSRQWELPPLVIVPYLSETALRMLEAEKVCGIDLCGNGMVTAPGLSLWRSGQPNRFTESQPLRNIYRGNISLPARAFLLQGEFPSLVALRAFVLERLLLSSDEEVGSKLTKGTVSKVIQILDAENMVLRSKESVRLSSPQRLLEELRNNAAIPRGPRLVGKTSLSTEEVWNRLNANGMRAVVTGDGSSQRYGVLSGVDPMALYVDDLEGTEELLEVKETRVFPNLTLIQEKNDVVYFDARKEGAVRWASPLQTWLELTLGGPREREAAQTLEAALLKGQANSLLSDTPG